MARQALEVLRDVFGFQSFRGQQAEIIEHVLGGGDALVLMPTGGGKSLCYQVPALCRPGTAVVISPLIALMQDQVEALRYDQAHRMAAGLLLFSFVLLFLLYRRTGSAGWRIRT